jgi:hypothetical protein
MIRSAPTTSTPLPKSDPHSAHTAAWSEATVPGYRAVNSLAVVSLLLGVLSVAAWLDWSMAVLPLAGILAGVRSWRTINLRSDELTGKTLAKTGIVLSALFWATGWSWLSYDYATEVPEGYQRVTFDVLQPPASAVSNTPSAPNVPRAAVALDGKRVFMKGYVLPARQSTDIKDFILVWNSGDCCFGTTPTVTHMIAVTLQGPLRMDYSTKARKVAGTFHVDPGASADGQGVVYRLDADYLQ